MTGVQTCALPIFVALVAALTLGAGYLMETGTDVRLAIGTVEFNLGPLQAVIAALVILGALWLVLKVAGLLVATLRFINGDDTAISRYFNRNRERRGYKALADGMMALASGEGRAAMAKAALAERYLKRPELTSLITAQAAEMVGDRKKAEDTYKRLLKRTDTRFVGIRGILKQKLAQGDTDMALQLAQKAFALKPRNEEMQDTLLKLQAEHADWSGARKTLGAKLKTGHMPRDLHRRRDAVLGLSEARDLLESGKAAEARDAAIAANKMSPDLVPAAVMAARALIQQGKGRNAARVIRKAWESQPHPELAAAFAEIAPDEGEKARLQRFEELLRIKPNHPESRMLKAELLIAAEDFPGARRALGDLAETDPTTRSLSIMAAIERGAGADDAVVRGWLAKAVTASRGPQWVCGNCHSIEPRWAPVCSNCGGFDTLSWTEAPQTDLTTPTGTEMLPLMVGRDATDAGSADLPAEPAEPPLEATAEDVKK